METGRLSMCFCYSYSFLIYLYILIFYPFHVDFEAAWPPDLLGLELRHQQGSTQGGHDEDRGEDPPHGLRLTWNPYKAYTYLWIDIDVL